MPQCFSLNTSLAGMTGCLPPSLGFSTAFSDSRCPRQGCEVLAMLCFKQDLLQKSTITVTYYHHSLPLWCCLFVEGGQWSACGPSVWSCSTYSAPFTSPFANSVFFLLLRGRLTKMVGFNINLAQIGLTDVERSFLTVGSTFWKQFR